MGRDRKGRFTTGYSPDRGRGPAPGVSARVSGAALREIVLEVANTSVSVPRGRGRGRVTLFEALILRLGSGRVRHRAAVMDFIRLVFESAEAPTTADASMPSLQQDLADLRAGAVACAAADVEQSAVCIIKGFAELFGGRRD